MNDNKADTLETFFAFLDEATMEEMIGIFERGDESRLKENIEKLPDDVPKKELLESLALIKQMK